MSEDKSSNEIKVDVVIPVYRPGRRLEELIRRLRSQSFSINRIFILELVKDDRYSEVTTTDGIMNFSYENGEVSFNGVHKKDNDIINFKNEDGKTPVEVVYVPYKKFTKKGMATKVLEVAKAEYIWLLNQDMLAGSRHTLARMLEPFKNKNVKAAFGRIMPARELGYIDKNEYRLCTKSDGGIIEISEPAAVAFSAFYSFNDCALYKRDVISDYVVKQEEDATLWNEDMMMIDDILYHNGIIAYADSEVKCYRRNSSEYIYTRSYELANSSKNTRFFRMKGLKFANKSSLIKTSFANLITRGKGYLGGKLLVYVILEKMGVLAATVIPKRIVDTVYKNVIEPMCLKSK